MPLERLCKLQGRVEVTKQHVFFVRRYPEYTSYHHYSAFKTEVTMVVVDCQGKAWMLSSSSVLAQQEKGQPDVTLGRYPG